MANRIETGLQITGLSGDTNALYVVGNSLVNGDVNITGNVNVIGTATTLNTETVQTKDNRILLNYSGTSLSAIGGGIEVLSAKTDGSNTSLTTDINSDWNMNVGLNITGRTNDSLSYGLKVKNNGGTDNMVVRNDGNVGIGITSPTAKLHLVGSTDTSSSNSLYISDSASTATFILRDDGGLIVGKNANTSLGNSNSLTIGSQSLATGTNSVAVGHLASASGTESTSFGKQTISSNDGTTSIGSNSTASGQQSVAIGRASTASSTESIAIGRLNTSSNTGAITIGSQSQSTGTRSEVIGSFSFSKSDYSTSIGSFININTGLTGANVIGYGLTAGGGQELSATTSNSLALGWNSTTPSFLFSKSSDSYLNGSGNVGIGITSPTAKLHINNTGSTNTVLFEDDTNPDSSPFVIDNTGSVGVGTTTPAAKLDIIGTGSSSSSIAIKVSNNTGTQNIKFLENGVALIGGNTTWDGYSAAQFARAGGGYVLQESSQGYKLYDNSSSGGFWGIQSLSNNQLSIERFGIGAPMMTFDSNLFRIGAFTTTPTAQLHVRNTTYTDAFRVENTLGTDLVVSFSGNVGIATSSPTAKLDISGSTGYNQLRIRTSFTPSGSTDTSGNIGDVSWDDDYVYVKTFSGWGRTQLSYSF